MKRTAYILKRAWPVVLLLLLSQAVLIILIIVAKPDASQKVVNSSCYKQAGIRVISITAEGFKPKDVSVPLCTEVIFTNNDTVEHLPAFGEHPHHVDPSGFSEKLLKPHDSNGYLANATGNLVFHDHLNDEFTGSLTIYQ